MQQDTTTSIVKSAGRFFSGTLLSRITGMVRDIAMAATFGTHPAVAAFFVAFRLSHLFRRLLGEGALQAAFIPRFEELRKKGEAQALAFFYTLSLCLTLILLLGIGLATFFLGTNGSEVQTLTALMLPSLLFICLYGLNAALLQCEGHYFTTSVAPVAFNLIWIAGIFWNRHLTPSVAMEKMAYFIIAACFCQWLLTVPQALKQLIGKFSLDFSSVKQFLTPLCLGIVGVAASQINNAADAVFARFADPEGPAYLWYAIRIQQLPLALFGVALSSSLLPPLARANGEQFRHFTRFALKVAAAVMLPITLFLMIGGEKVVCLLYQRGDFLTESVVGTSKCLLAYSFGLLPMTLVLVLAPALYALNDYKTPAKASALTMGLNLCLNTLMIFSLGFGATSVAIATSISAWVNLFLLGRSLTRSPHWSFLGKVTHPGKF